MPRYDDIDLSAIDIRSLTPGEWEALKREVTRRAHAERAKVIGSALAWVRNWWQDGRQDRCQRPSPVAQARATTDLRMFAFGGRP